MRIQIETRTLPTELSAEDLAKESDRLASAVKEVEKQEDHIAEQKGLWAEKKKAMDGYLSHLKEEMGGLATIVETGKADRKVECSWLYSLKSGFAFLVRDDTGELVTHRRLGDAERQENLLEVLREPTEEQLTEWTSSLGLELDPQGDLPLAGANEPTYYYRDFTLTMDGRDIWITGRFTEADHRPESLAGVAYNGEPREGTGLPEQVDRGALEYEADGKTISTFRQALEDLLEQRRGEAQLFPSTGEREPEDEPPAPTPIGRGRKAK